MQHTVKYVLALAVTVFIALPQVTPAAANDDRAVAHDRSGDVVVNRFENCVRTKWIEGTDPCAPPPPPVVTPPPQPRVYREIKREERTVYFDFNKAEIVDSEQRKLDNLAEILKSEKSIRSVSIVGYADRIGTESYNDELSQRRAKTVEAYLHSRGYFSTTVAQTRWLGEGNPVTDCSDKLKRPELIQCLAQDRRVEVEIDYVKETVR